MCTGMNIARMIAPSNHAMPLLAGAMEPAAAPAASDAITASVRRAIFITGVNAMIGSAATYPGMPARRPKLSRVATASPYQQACNDGENRTYHEIASLLQSHFLVRCRLFKSTVRCLSGARRDDGAREHQRPKQQHSGKEPRSAGQRASRRDKVGEGGGEQSRAEDHG